MDFEAFTAALVANFVRHDFMQDEITAAGIELDKLPVGLVARPVYTKYLELRKTMSHELAAFELSKDCDVLQKFAGRQSDIPKDPDVLRERFEHLYGVYKYKELAKRIELAPGRGAELVENFDASTSGAVEFKALSELSGIVDTHQSEGKADRQCIKIPGYEKLSEMIGGFNPSRTGIFLGGTGFGKTNFAVNLSLAASIRGGVGYVNMEMSYSDMVKRFAVISSGISYQDYSRGNFDKDQAKESVNKDNIFLTSGRGLSFKKIASWARLLKAKKGIEILIVDYDQRVDLNLKHQAEEWKALQIVLERFEELAKELGIYVLILAQVNRDGFISGSHRAQFSAHTVLAFHDHESFGPVIEAKKNRHGRKDQALTVIYDERNSRITEGEIITVGKPKAPERKQLTTPKKEEPWFKKM